MTDYVHADGSPEWRVRTPRRRLSQALTIARRATGHGRAEGDDTGHAPVVDIFDPDASPAPPEAPTRSEVRHPADLVTDLGPPAGFGGPAPRRDGDDYGLGREWGSTWRWTAQGWVDQDAGVPRWRPVVTTTTEFPEWQVDTYLGMVAGEAAVVAVPEPSLLGRALDEGRAVAMRGLTDAAIARGAHAVVGAALAYTTIDDRVVVTATGTAVTLRDR